MPLGRFGSQYIMVFTDKGLMDLSDQFHAAHGHLVPNPVREPPGEIRIDFQFAALEAFELEDQLRPENDALVSVIPDRNSDDLRAGTRGSFIVALANALKAEEPHRDVGGRRNF